MCTVQISKPILTTNYYCMRNKIRLRQSWREDRYGFDAGLNGNLLEENLEGS